MKMLKLKALQDITVCVLARTTSRLDEDGELAFLDILVQH